jgi:hypothetical protein
MSPRPCTTWRAPVCAAAAELGTAGTDQPGIEAPAFDLQHEFGTGRDGHIMTGPPRFGSGSTGLTCP